jgi:hypothetical protein
MKRSAYVAVGAVILMMAAGAAFAMEGDQLTAKIPFQFMVNNQTLPAGTYEIAYAQPDDETSMAIRSMDGKAEDTFFVEDAAAAEGAKKTELVFDEIGNQHFLTQIWVAGQDQGHQVALTKSEKELISKGNAKTERRVAAEHSMHKTAKSK